MNYYFFIGLFILVVFIFVIVLFSKSKATVKRENGYNRNITNISSDGDSQGRKYNILLVDDNDLNNKVLVRLIGKYNANVDVVNSGNDCIQKIKDGNNYDLILLDYLMPVMSGRDTLIQLKSINPSITNIYALATSEGEKNNALNDGFNGCLMKPINQNDLDMIINNIK